jgi:transposase
MVGYNVQTAVDAKHHLIVTHEVTNQGHDRHQLHNMAQQAKEVIGSETLAVVADRGYFKGEELLACEKSQITTYLPKPQTSGSTKKGLFSKHDFIYQAKDDEYECPTGERLIWRFETQEKGLKIHKYWSSHCPNCSIKSQCTTSQYRRVARWEHEAVLVAAEARLEQEPERMRTRRETVEHPFGTLKSWMGYTHFQTKTLKHVSTEMSLHVLAYNYQTGAGNSRREAAPQRNPGVRGVLLHAKIGSSAPPMPQQVGSLGHKTEMPVKTNNSKRRGDVLTRLLQS